MLAKFIDKAREDSLTASVFSHLLHLTSEQFWKILSGACYTKMQPEHPGEPILVVAWPNWNATKTSNEFRVFPDLLIRFTDFDLIIEAKIAEAGTQYREQWQNELIAYTNEYGKEKRQVRMIALGGIHSERGEPLSHTWSEPNGRSGESHHFECLVHMCQWSTVLLECQRLKRELERKKHSASRMAADIRILNDLIALFAAHNYPALQWFKDFDFKSNFLTPLVDSDQQFFRNISHQFQS